MTEQELINSMQALTAAAASVLQNIQNYAVGTTAVTFAIGGQNVVIPSMSQQVAAYAAQQAADRLAYMQNFGGLPASQAIARDTQGRVSSITTIFTNGYQNVMTPSRDPVTGKMTGVSVIITDPLGVQVVNVSKTLKYVNGRYAGV